MNGKLFILFEFGIPHYRGFLLEKLNASFQEIVAYHADDKFSGTFENHSSKCKCFGSGENKLCIFNVFSLLSASAIVTTLNLRRPHTWVPMLLLPWKKWIIWGSGVGENSSLIVRFLRRILLFISDGFVVYTENGRKKLIEFGYSDEKITVAYNTLKIENSCLTSGEKYFLYVGRVQKRKELDACFHAIKKLQKKLLVVGGDYNDEISRLKVLADEEGCSDLVEFRSPIYDDAALKDVFSNAIAYVSPGHVGLGVVHAFGYGVPVVTFMERNHAPEFEYCNKHNSYLVLSDNISDALYECLNKPVEHFKRRESAYCFYKENLSVKNVYNAFFCQFERLGISTDKTDVQDIP
ncbi:Glycosyltransferase involved in cell wall bisynthesis [Franzmannia pantelleriensis]|uniref:Glycosyltransferase involved in cell wall bisynthesis n=1 Tax=Franzmannia pantelleriensis TaxID=48727 RepID=A0A1G9EDH6_9GAMM|nr:glycosyltransferase [Halomonas pantelleriensis]SDK74199.1 Glycosyltransferase involved in cell wall bisynthesis [Halomonas pantelleriensis]